MCLTALLADTVVLRSGKIVEGTYLGGDARKVRVAVAERVDTFDISDVAEIKFGSDSASAPAAAAAPPAAPSAEAASAPKPPARNEVLRPDTPLPARPATSASRSAVEIPAGASLVIRMIDDVDSERDTVGQTFRASVDEPLIINNETVVPRGADVVAKLVDDKESGKLTGRTELTLDLVSLNVNGKTVEITTHEVTQASESRTGRTAKVVGGTAALGAIIGAIAGGGKGAAIGGLSGAAAGGAVQVLTKGQRVRIPSETRLSFTLQQPLKI